MTLLQKIKYRFIRLWYKLTQAVPNYNIKIGQTVIIFSLHGEKLHGKVIAIDRIEDYQDGVFLDNEYEIRGELSNYLIYDSQILCVFNVNL